MKDPKIAALCPVEIELEAGKKYFYCTCGLSKKQPFCDGAHKGTEFRPSIIEPDKTCKKWICQCKCTRTPPFCDGAHKTIKQDKNP